MAIHHIAFRVGDLEQSTAFYREMLALRVRRDASPRAVWLAIDADAVLMLEKRPAGEATTPPDSMDLVAFRVEAAEKARIRALCIDRGCFDGETEHTVYLRDPDGRRIGVSTYSL